MAYHAEGDLIARRVRRQAGEPSSMSDEHAQRMLSEIEEDRISADRFREAQAAKERALAQARNNAEKQAAVMLVNDGYVNVPDGLERSPQELALKSPGNIGVIDRSRKAQTRILSHLDRQNTTDKDQMLHNAGFMNVSDRRRKNEFLSDKDKAMLQLKEQEKAQAEKLARAERRRQALQQHQERLEDYKQEQKGKIQTAAMAPEPFYKKGDSLTVEDRAMSRKQELQRHQQRLEEHKQQLLKDKEKIKEATNKINATESPKEKAARAEQRRQELLQHQELLNSHKHRLQQQRLQQNREQPGMLDDSHQNDASATRVHDFSSPILERNYTAPSTESPKKPGILAGIKNFFKKLWG